MTAEELIKEIKERREQLKMYIIMDLEKAPYTNKSNMQFFRVGYYEMSRLLEWAESRQAKEDANAAIR